MNKSKALTFITFFFSLIISSQSQAVLLTEGTNALSGTTAAANPNLAGTIIVDELTDFSFNAYGGTVTGTVQTRIVESIDNTLDFYWRVFNDSSSAGAVADFRIGEFEASYYDADFRIDGLGDEGPSSAHLFDTSVFNGYINFNFGTDGLLAGTSSNFFFLDTDATEYDRTGIYDLTNIGQSQISGLFSMYAPSTTANVTEPSTLALLGLGLLGFGLRKRRL